MLKWYVIDGGVKAGPFSNDEFFDYVKGRDPTHVQIWRQGMDAWVPASKIPQLLELMTPASNTANARLATTSGADRLRHPNFLVRLWRGDLPLWASFWLFTVPASVILGFAATVATKVTLNDPDYSPETIFLRLIAIWIVTFILATWQMKALWGAAGRYRKVRAASVHRALFGYLAQGTVVGSLIVLAGAAVMEGIPLLYTGYRIAFQDDPDVPSYSIRVIRDGSAVEISGGIKYGLADNFTNILNASPAIKLVHLESVGGRFGEALKLFEIIQDKGLSTYVASQCLSACVIAFAGGRERLLAEGASLGFDSGAFLELSDAGFERAQSYAFRRVGFDPTFIDEAMARRDEAPWRPSADRLLRGKVVTSVVDPSHFAASGPERWSRSEMVKTLRAAIPLLDALQQKYPRLFDEVVDEFQDSLSKGRPDPETRAMLRAKVNLILKGLLPLADDDVLSDLNRLVTDQFVVLREGNPSDCYAYASGSRNVSDFSERLPDDLRERERNIYDRVIKTATPRPNPDPGRMNHLQDIVRQGLVRAGVTESQFELLRSSILTWAQQAQFCDLSILMFREIGKLPQGDGAIVMRALMGNK